MKSGFSKSVLFVPKYNGNEALPEADKLKAICKPMSNGDVFLLADTLSGFGVKKTEEKDKLDSTQVQSLIGSCGEFVPRYVELQGNEDFTIQDVVTYMHYFDLAVELLFKLVEISQPTKADVKN
jgi:hypothetical protein